MSEPQKEDKTTFLHAFKQQIMKAWQPVPTLNSTIIIFFVLSVIFLTFGIVLIAYSSSIIDHQVRYDTKCSDVKLPIQGQTFVPTICYVQLSITEDMDGPVFVYYELDNFYQNHRRYVKSKNINQLQGDSVSSSNLDDCSPIIYNKDLRKYRVIKDVLKDDDVANPCGLIAASLFNDTYTLYNQPYTAGSSSYSNEISISSSNIAWPSDKSSKFKRHSNWETVQWHDVEDERFMVWMRTAALPYFRKLWGRINDGLKKGEYTIMIANQYPVDSFDGKKYFVVSTANAFGGRNSFLGISYLVMGIICVLILLIFLYKKCSHQRGKNQKEK